MNAFEKRLSLADVKAGVPFWTVFSVDGRKASLEDPDPWYFTEEPELVTVGGNTGAYKLTYIKSGRIGVYHDFDGDRNIHRDPTKKQYNFHTMFGSLEDAQEYVSMISRDALPDELRKIRHRIVQDDCRFRQIWGS